MGKVSEKKLQKEQTLLETAFHLFTTQGVSETSISDIVQRAGVAKGTFYLYFHDKYDLRDRLIARKAQQLFQHALDCSQYAQYTDCADRVIAVADDILEQLRRDPVLLRFLGKNLSWGVFRRAFGQPDSEHLEKLREVLGERLAQSENTLYLIIELVGSTAHSVILYGVPTDLDSFKPELYRAIRAVIGAAENAHV